MSRYFIPLTQAQPKNALIDFSPINNGLNAIGEAQQNATRNAMMREEMDMRKEQHQFQRDRATAQDEQARRERGGKMAAAIMQMPDNDPGKQGAWRRYLSEFGDGNHSPEELDFRTGPKIAAAAFGHVVDPLAQEDRRLGIDLKRAQIAKAQRESTGAGAKYGKTGAIFQGPDGAFYSVQFAEDGTKKIEPIAVDGNGLTPARGVMEVGDTLRDKSTGQVRANIAGNIEAGKRSEVIGKAKGEAIGSAPSDIQAADQALGLIDQLRKHEGLDIGTGGTSIGNYVWGTKGYSFQKLVDQVTGGAFLTAVQQMRGLGALSNNEGKAATQAVTRMSSALDKKSFLKALDDYESIVRVGRAKAEAILRGEATPDPSAALRQKYGLE